MDHPFDCPCVMCDPLQVRIEQQVGMKDDEDLLREENAQLRQRLEELERDAEIRLEANANLRRAIDAQQVLVARNHDRAEAAEAKLAKVAHLVEALAELVEAVARLEGIEIPYPVAIPIGIKLRLAQAALAAAKGE